MKNTLFGNIFDLNLYDSEHLTLLQSEISVKTPKFHNKSAYLNQKHHKNLACFNTNLGNGQTVWDRFQQYKDKADAEKNREIILANIKQ